MTSDLPLEGRRRVWVLQGARLGDNIQARELASRLDAEIVLKSLSFNLLHHAPNWALGAGRASLAAPARKLLVAPWPDVVIAAGKRTVPIARWIKAASGGVAKLVHIGRPRAALRHFDLVVTTPQYGLPAAPNLIEMELPLAGMPTAAGGETWRAEWRELPRPLIALAIGGGKFPLRLGAAEWRRLGAKADHLAAALGGSLLVFASPRSAPDALRRVQQQLRVPHRFYAWHAGGENPYRAALEIADRFIVTADSASMIGEALATGKPVSLFLPPVSPLFATWNASRGLAAWLARTGLLQPPRDTRKIAASLLRRGYVTQLGAEAGPTVPFQTNDTELITRLSAVLNSQSA